MPAEPFAQALARKGHREAAAQKGERHEEDLRRHLDIIDPHPDLGEVDRRLFARSRLDAHGRDRRRGGPQRRDRTAYNDQRPRAALLAPLAVEHRRLGIDLERALRDPRPMQVRRRHHRLGRPLDIGPAPAPRTDRLAVEAVRPRDR